MGSAFKCDSCGDLIEGQPERFKTQHYATAGMMGWTGSTTLASGELCESCTEEFEQAVREFLDGESDE